MLKKSLAVGIIVFLVISSVPYSTLSDEISTGTFGGNTLYVGGTGPGNYSKIQDAVDNASDGDIIIVKDGRYIENIDVPAQLTIISENGAQHCVVEAATPSEHVFDVTADYVNISGFTVLGATHDKKAGIYIQYTATYCNIFNNIISNNYNGLFLSGTSNNVIVSNEIYNNKLVGIHLDGSPYNNISSNHIYNNNCSIRLFLSLNNNLYSNELHDNYAGIDLRFSSNKNNVSSNHIYNNYCGIYSFFLSSNNNLVLNEIHNNNFGIYFTFSSKKNYIASNQIYDHKYCGISLIKSSSNNTIHLNEIYNNDEGIYLAEGASNNQITNNNFDNHYNAYFHYSKDEPYRNTWFRNYWSNWYVPFPKPIIGVLSMNDFNIPWLQFDWHPAKEPYDIPIPEVP